MVVSCKEDAWRVEWKRPFGSKFHLVDRIHNAWWIRSNFATSPSNQPITTLCYGTWTHTHNTHVKRHVRICSEKIRSCSAVTCPSSVAMALNSTERIKQCMTMLTSNNCTESSRCLKTSSSDRIFYTWQLIGMTRVNHTSTCTWPTDGGEKRCQDRSRLTSSHLKRRSHPP